MSELSNFLMKNKVADLTEDVELSGRLEGMKFKIKVVTSEDMENYNKVCTKPVLNGRKQETTVDTTKLRMLILKNHIIEPNIKDAKFLEDCECKTPEQFIGERLLVGEQVKLQESILSLSGFDTDLKEDVEEAKN